jgi:hypothetical protein
MDKDRMIFEIEFFTDDSYDHKVSGDNHVSETLYQHPDETGNKFALRVVDFINECAMPLTKVSSVFRIDELDEEID